MPEPPKTEFEGNQYWVWRQDGPYTVRPSTLATQYEWMCRGAWGRRVLFCNWVRDQITYDCYRDETARVERFTIGGASA